MPEAFEVKGIHLVEGLLRSPTVKSDPIDGDENATAVIAEPAVHVDLASRNFSQERKELRDLFIGRR
jgi:hypothetical protein